MWYIIFVIKEDILMIIKDWNIFEMTGYEPKTTFYTDFSIADNFGVSAIKDTFKRSFENWKHNYVYLTELVMVLNWKEFEHQNNDEYLNLYYKLWCIADEYACNNLKGDELTYFFRTTD